MTCPPLKLKHSVLLVMKSWLNAIFPLMNSKYSIILLFLGRNSRRYACAIPSFVTEAVCHGTSKIPPTVNRRTGNHECSLVTMNAANLSLNFQWHYYNNIHRFRYVLGKTFKAQAHYKHVVITKVLFVAC